MVNIDENAIVVGGVAYYTLKKLLGPTAEYLGAELKEFVEKSQANVGRILGAAARRLGDKLDEPGEVAPRVLARILDEGRFCEDRLGAEYFGGLLASSRCNGPGGDRTLPMLGVLKNLPVLAIRIHYLGYACFRNAYSTYTPSDDPGEDIGVFIRASDLLPTLASSDPRPSDLVITDALEALRIAELVRSPTRWGETKGSARWVQNLPGPGLILTPTNFGVRLFMSAHGLPDHGSECFVDPLVKLELNAGICVPPGVMFARFQMPLTG